MGKLVNLAKCLELQVEELNTKNILEHGALNNKKSQKFPKTN